LSLKKSIRNAQKELENRNSAQPDGAAKSPALWRENKIKLVVALRPNKQQAFNAPCALSLRHQTAMAFALGERSLPRG